MGRRFPAAGSEAVVVARVVDGNSEMTREGKAVVTYYSVAVTETMKGHVQGRLLVQTLGGTVTFPDGAVVEGRTNFRLVRGSSYAMFLRSVPDGEGAERGAWMPVLGPQGVFDVSESDRGVRAFADPAFPVVAAHQGRDVAAFLKDVRRAAVVPAQQR